MLLENTQYRKLATNLETLQIGLFLLIEEQRARYRSHNRITDLNRSFHTSPIRNKEAF